jgi:hypothetical protein
VPVIADARRVTAHGDVAGLDHELDDALPGRAKGHDTA